MASPRHSLATPFGALSIDAFLRDYWRRRPLLVRGAIPTQGLAITRESLRVLARRDDIEARLVTAHKGHWALEHAPLAHLPRAAREWTLLVQGANHHFSQLDALMRRFSFVPYTRLDDLMVSYATDGGGVGAHFDSYDVFLIQASGQRRWRISTQSDLELIEGLPLKILRDFRPEEQWVLEPGDLLYLPPGVAHEGVALGECMTYSVGFRAPDFTTLGREFLGHIADRLELPGRFDDTTRAPTGHPARLDAQLLDAVAQKLAGIRWSARDITAFLGCYLSEPKAHVYFDPPAPPSPAQFLKRAARCGVRADARTQLLYRGRRFFINGEQYGLDRGAAATLAQFADERCMSSTACGKLSVRQEQAMLLFTWFQAGWIVLGDGDE